LDDAWATVLIAAGLRHLSGLIGARRDRLEPASPWKDD
jgi:hypothetical protein